MLYISIAPISPRHHRKSSFLELNCKISLICQNTQCYLPLTDAAHYRICTHVFNYHISMLRVFLEINVLIRSKDGCHHCLNRGFVGSSESSWVSRSRRPGEDIKRTPPSQKPAQQGNQTGESGCQQWLIRQEKTQQFSFPSLTNNLHLLCCLLER